MCLAVVEVISFVLHEQCAAYTQAELLLKACMYFTLVKTVALLFVNIAFAFPFIRRIAIGQFGC